MWLLAQTKPNAMALAVSNLQRQGFATFLPLERKTRIRQNRLQQTTAPYFGNYLFVLVTDKSAPVSQLRSTYGVLRLVEFGGKIAELPLQFIDELKNSCDEEGCLELPSSTQAGDSVRVIGGPFHNKLGKVERLASNDRIWVLLDVLGQVNRTLMAKTDLARV